jgi:hypothetical protein
MQDGEVVISDEDIIVNLPYHPDCGMWFDHHISEYEKGSRPGGFKGKYGLAPSCARLIYDYYNLPNWKKYESLLEETDRIDSAQLSLSDILRPEGWVRLSNTVDPRSGYIPSHDYFLQLVELIRDLTIEEIILLDDVRDRVREFFKQQDEYKVSLLKNSYLNGDVIVTDFRGEAKIPIGSRFLIYALFPGSTVSVRVFNSDHSDRVVLAVGHSIINRKCKVDVGNLLAEYGGGGHVGAGTCKVMPDLADGAINDIVERLNAGV